MVRVLLTDQTSYLNKELAFVLAEGEHSIVFPDNEQDEAAFIEDVTDNVDVVVLDLVRDAANANRILGSLSATKFEEPKTVIAVSSVMTWNETKTKKNKPLSESDFKNRKCTPKFKELKLLETLVLSANSDSLNTMVVAPGVMYGSGEDSFADLFRDAWMCEVDSLTVIGEGNNKLPLVHVKDCAKFIERISVTLPENKYMVVIDSSDMNQRQVVETISQGLGNGQVTSVSEDDEKLLLDESNSIGILASGLNFNKESLFLTSLGMTEEDWHSENFKNSFDKVRVEFCQNRNLEPLRVAVVGPPGAGKSFYSANMAQKYSVPHLQLHQVIKEALEAKDELAEAAKASMAEQVEKAPKGGKGKKKAAPKKGKAKPKPDDGPQLPLKILAQIIRRKLLSPPCRNKGFVLDGFPRTAQEASALFEVKNDDEEPEPEEEEGAPEKPLELDPNIMVQYIVSIDSTRGQAQARALEIPQENIVEGHNDEESFNRRWQMFEYIMDEKPEGPSDPLPFFKTTETLELAADVATQVDVTMDAIDRYINAPFNFHPTPEEIAEQEAQAAITQKKSEELAKATALRQEEEERAKAEALEHATHARKNAVLAEDAELVEEASLPLRRYLMKNVIPPLVDGLLDVCKTQPEDPIDYLAEYLFRHTMTPQNQTR